MDDGRQQAKWAGVNASSNCIYLELKKIHGFEYEAQESMMDCDLLYSHRLFARERVEGCDL